MTIIMIFVVIFFATIINATMGLWLGVGILFLILTLHPDNNYRLGDAATGIFVSLLAICARSGEDIPDVVAIVICATFLVAPISYSWRLWKHKKAK